MHHWHMCTSQAFLGRGRAPLPQLQASCHDCSSLLFAVHHGYFLNKINGCWILYWGFSISLDILIWYVYVCGGREGDPSHIIFPCSNVKLALHSLDKLELVLNRQFLLYLLGFSLLVAYFSTLKMPLKWGISTFQGHTHFKVANYRVSQVIKMNSVFRGDKTHVCLNANQEF